MATSPPSPSSEMEKQQSSAESRSWSARETIKGSHLYMVKGFSLFKGMGPGEFISSDVFSVGGYDWAIHFYPNGDDEEKESTYVSAFLVLMSKNADVEAVYNLSLKDQTGDEHFTLGFNKNGPKKFNSNKSKSWGYNKFYERSKLESSKYFREDCLVLCCNIGVVIEGEEPRKEFSICFPPSNFGKCFKDLLESENAADIVFKIGKKTFKAHKLILAARSSVFQAQFYGPLGKPSTHELVIEDIPEPVFQALLDFIYTDSLPNWKKLKSSSSSSSTTFADHLLVAANLYGLDHLKLFCEDKLSKELTIETVGSNLVLAERYNCSHLKSACMNFVVFQQNLGGVVKSKSFQKLKKFPELLLEVLQNIAANGFWKPEK